MHWKLVACCSAPWTLPPCHLLDRACARSCQDCACTSPVLVGNRQCPFLQVKYVVELARAISLHPAVHRVELLTRLIADPKVCLS